jgi:dolichyl-phosphate-mannose--protein O-mannosyl transferase
MSTVTISKKVTKGEELVVISRKEYKKFLFWQKYVPTEKLTVAQRRDLEQARNEYKQGKYLSMAQLERELGITHKKAR